MRTLFSVFMAVILGLAALNFSTRWPGDPDNPEPTRISLLIQTYLSGWYEPPLLVFVSRYGNGVNDTHRTSIVLGPDCRRVGVMVRNDPAGAGLPPITGVRTRYCERPIDDEKLMKLARERMSTDGQERFYFYLTDEQLARIAK